MIAAILAAVPLLADDDPRKPVHRLPTLSAVFPQGARPGETVRVEVLGEHLDRVSSLHFTHPALSARILKVDPTRLELEISSRSDAPLEPHYFRAISPRGASNIALFRLGDQPHRNETEPNSTLDDAERVPVPVTINARLDRDNDFDLFRFHAAKGETLVFDLRSARNGSGLDASMILADTANRKLEHDEDTFVWDPFFTHTFAAEGDYIAIVQPTHARNDPGFNYQLDIRRAPHLRTMHPLSLRPGSGQEVTLFGSGLVDRGAKIRFDAPGLTGEIVQARGETAVARIRAAADVAPGDHTLWLESGGRSNPAKFVVDATPPHEGGGPLKAPASTTGIAKYRQPERWKFHAAAGQTLAFEVRAARYGSAADSVLRILDAKGKAAANNDDGAFPGVNFNKDARLVHRFQEAGEYTLELRNLFQVTGEDFPYQLTMSDPEPGFDLQLSTDQPFFYPGEPKAWKIAATRKDSHDAAIPLIVEGLPEGFVAKAAAIAAGSREGEIEVTAPAGAAPGTFARVRVMAGKPAVRQARISSGGGEGATFATVDHAFAVVAEKPKFSLECAATSVNLVRGGSVELKVAIRRDAGFDGPVTLRALNLPDGVTSEAEPSASGEGVVRFRAAASASLGRAARVAVMGDGGGQTQEAPKVSILVD